MKIRKKESYNSAGTNSLQFGNVAQVVSTLYKGDKIVITTSGGFRKSASYTYTKEDNGTADGATWFCQASSGDWHRIAQGNLIELLNSRGNQVIGNITDVQIISKAPKDLGLREVKLPRLRASIYVEAVDARVFCRESGVDLGYLRVRLDQPAAVVYCATDKNGIESASDWVVLEGALGGWATLNINNGEFHSHSTDTLAYAALAKKLHPAFLYKN